MQERVDHRRRCDHHRAAPRWYRPDRLVHRRRQITLESSTGADLSVTGKADLLKALGLTTAIGAGNATVTAARTTSAASLGTLIQDGSTLNVDGQTITFKNAQTPQSAASVPTGSGVSGNVVTDGNGNSTVYLQSATVADVLNAIDLATGVQTATHCQRRGDPVDRDGPDRLVDQRQRPRSRSAPASAPTCPSPAPATRCPCSASPATPARRRPSPRPAPPGVGGINGKTLTFTSFNGGTAVNVTFGDGTNGTVKTLDQLNTALQANNLSATIDANGKLTISATNDYASSTLGFGGGGRRDRRHASPAALTFSTASARSPIRSRRRRARTWSSQYNNILAQINTTSQDCFVQRRQPAQRRSAQAGVRRDRQVDASTSPA